MLHHEVTASSLVKVDMRGDMLDVGASGTGLGVNKLGFSLHAAVYASRPDIKCIVHLRCPSAVAVSVQCVDASTAQLLLKQVERFTFAQFLLTNVIDISIFVVRYFATCISI